MNLNKFPMPAIHPYFSNLKFEFSKFFRKIKDYGSQKKTGSTESGVHGAICCLDCLFRGEFNDRRLGRAAESEWKPVTDAA